MGGSQRPTSTLLGSGFSRFAVLVLLNREFLRTGSRASSIGNADFAAGRAGGYSSADVVGRQHMEEVFTPLKETTVVPMKCCPCNKTDAPVPPLVGWKLTTTGAGGGRPRSITLMVPLVVLFVDADPLPRVTP